MGSCALALRSRWRQRARDDSGAANGLMPVILLAAGFTIIILAFFAFMHKAVENKTVDAATCIEGPHSYGGHRAAESCNGNTANTGNNSFTKDEAYTSRY